MEMLFRKGKDMMSDLKRYSRRGKTTVPYFYLGLGLVLIAGIWKYHRYLMEGGLQEREIPAMYESGIKPRVKRGNISAIHWHSSHWHLNASLYPGMCSVSDRILHLHKECKNNRHAFLNTKVDFGKQFIVDDEHKVIYCQVPHVGSNSVKTAIMQTKVNQSQTRQTLDRNRPMGDWRHGLESYGLTHMTQLLPRYKAYRKFLIVRHPLDRILSAYYTITSDISLNKIHKSTNDYLKAMLNVGSDLRQLKLQQFIDFITDKNKSPQWVYNNQHWRPMIDICFPCHIKYNRVLRLETLSQDSIFLKSMNISPSDLPHLRKVQQGMHGKVKSGVKQLAQYSSIRPESLKKLIARYKIDMDIFGYTFDEKTHTAICKLPGSKHQHCC